MKPLVKFITGIILFTTVASADTVRVTRVVPGERDFVFLLKTKSKKLRIELDCSSFIHNLTLTSTDGDVRTHYLDNDECWALHQFYSKFDLRKKCLSSEAGDYEAHYCL